MSALKQISETALREFSALNDEQLNWKPDQQSWSIGQCLHHLIVSNEKYFPALKAVLEKDHKQSLWERKNPLTDYTGRKMIETLGPDVKKRYKSPVIFRPSKSGFSQKLVTQFTRHNEQLMELFSSLEKSGKTGLIITSPAAPLVTLRIRDVISLLIAHEERHMNQAVRVKGEDGFPVGDPL